MSRIGKLPVIIKEGVTVSEENGSVVVAGPKGTLAFKIPSGIDVTIANGAVSVATKKEDGEIMPYFGLTRASIANMIKGVTEGFSKQLELSGVGYRAQAAGSDLTLSVGYSHPVKIKAGEGITFSVSENVITVSGIDKKLVGDAAAEIRAVRPPEPYKGKGISYKGERIRRKAGKAAKAVGAAK